MSTTIKETTEPIIAKVNQIQANFYAVNKGRAQRVYRKSIGITFLILFFGINIIGQVAQDVFLILPGLFMGVVGGFVIGGIIGFVLNAKADYPFEKEFRSTVLKELMDPIGINAELLDDVGDGNKLIEVFPLIQGGKASLTNLVEGVYNERPFFFSQMEVTSRRGGGTTTHHFSGVVIYLRLKEKVSNAILVYPQVQAGENSLIGQSRAINGHMIRYFRPHEGIAAHYAHIENSEFDKNFRVFCPNKEEAKSFFTDERIALINELKKQNGEMVYMNGVDDQLCVLLQFPEKGEFLPTPVKIKENQYNFMHVEAYFKEVERVKNILDSF